MDEAKILIIGANGQLGKALQLKYPGAQAVDRDELDMTDWKALSDYDWSDIDVVLNAAAYTNVDGAETPEGRKAVWQINAVGAAYLSKIAAAHGMTLLHISTEYVFDGTQEPHVENEPLTPLGVYAQAKAAGDIAVSTAPKHYIIRISWLIGDGPNFVRTMMGLAAKDVSPKVVADQVGRLTFTSTLVAAIEHLFTTEAEFDTYNLSNEGDVASWADITRAIFQEMGRDDLTVSDSTTADYFASKPESAPRPLKSTLDLSKIEATGFKPNDWRQELATYIAKEASK